MVINDYKIIKIKSDNIHNYTSTIENIFSEYPKEDIFFNFNKNELIINLKQLNFVSFKKHIQKVLKNSNNSLSFLLEEILNNIESIKSYGLKDKKRLYVGYNRERKVQNRKNKEDIRGPFFYAKNNSFSKKNNDVPEKYINNIIVGDSEKILKNLPENCIDLIFTSPPYNFGLDYDNHKDGTDWNEYFNKLFDIFKQCIRVLKYSGRIIVNVQPLFSDYIPIHHILSDFFMKQRLIWKGEIIWEKHNYNCKYTAWGSWKSPSSPYLKYTWEFLEIFCKGTLKKKGEKENIDIIADEFKKWVYGKWDIAPERNMKKYKHPAMFPEKLVERVLKLFSYEKDIIMDPFNGVGSTTVVAKKLNRKYLGIDTSEEYCTIANDRLKNVAPNLYLFK